MANEIHRCSTTALFSKYVSVGALFALGSLTACSSTVQTEIGSSFGQEDHKAPQSLPEDSQFSAANAQEVTAPAPTGAKDGAGSKQGDQSPDPTDSKEAKEARNARQALKSSNAPTNHLGLAFAISERASDLKWLLAIENRSTAPVRLAIIPQLLQLEITPPKTEENTEGEQKGKKKTAKQKKEDATIKCGVKKLPKAVSDSEMTELSPGQLLIYAFDPRRLCKDDSVLSAGAQIKAMYGFPTNTKKKWKGGKLTTVEIEQKAPFVASRENSGEDEFVPLKHLNAEEFVLGSTYPLADLTALPSEDAETSQAEDDTKTGSKRDEKDSSGEKSASGPEMKLRISQLGTSKSPEKLMVKVRIVNSSSKKQKLFVRREIITYEVTGPEASFTCRMHPSERHPAASEFRSLAAGGSTSFSTRLAEACPQGSWDTPGEYSVSARLTATASGEKFGMQAFTGIAVTNTPARLKVPYKKGKIAPPAMKVVD